MFCHRVNVGCVLMHETAVAAIYIALCDRLHHTVYIMRAFGNRVDIELDRND